MPHYRPAREGGRRRRWEQTAFQASLYMNIERSRHGVGHASRRSGAPFCATSPSRARLHSTPHRPRALGVPSSLVRSFPSSPSPPFLVFTKAAHRSSIAGTDIPVRCSLALPLTFPASPEPLRNLSENADVPVVQLLRKTFKMAPSAGNPGTMTARTHQLVQHLNSDQYPGESSVPVALGAALLRASAPLKARVC